MTASLPSLADSLIQALHQPGQERLLDLVRNPLRLTLLCITWDGTLPETQAQLYENYLKKFYGWNQNLQELRDCAERCQTNITALKKQLNQQLGELAKAALDLPQERFRLSQALVEKYLGEELDDQSLCYIALQLGWLNRVGKDQRGQFIFDFYHATFQEYFAALTVDDWDYFLPPNHVNFPVAGKEYRIFEPQWKQVILLWLGRDIASEKKEEFIQELVDFKDGVIYFYEYQAYFLAAAVINEFKACSLALDIVRQVVTWGFGYFNIEKQEWQNFIDPIKEGTRKTIPETIRPLAITELIKIIENCPDEYIRKQAAESLGKIGQGNPQAIAALVKVIENTEDESTHWRAAESLGKIGQGNPQAIAALVKLIQTTEDEYTRWLAAESLGKIGQGNPQVIAALVKLIENNEDESTHWRAAESLGKIDPGNPQVIAALVKVIENTENEYTRKRAADSLGKIGQGNPQAIAALVKLIENTEDESTHWRAAESLGKIDPGNPQVIAALVKVIENTEDESTRREAADSLGKIDPGNPQVIAALFKVIENTENEFTRKRAAESLGKIDPGNPQVIAGLVKVIENTENEFTHWRTADSLGKIDPGNPQAIAALVKLIENTEDEDIRWLAAESLGEIGQGNPQVIAALVKLIENTEDEDTRKRAAESLEEIGQGNPQAIAGLVKVIENTENEFTRWQAAESLEEIDPGNPQVIGGLVKVIENTEDEDTRWRVAASLGKIDPGNPQAIAALVKVIENTEDGLARWLAAESLQKILTTPKQYAGVVSALKDSLSDEVYQNDFRRFDECYKVLWKCAANLPYPEFHQAWDHPPTTPHPEVPDQTPVGNNSTVENLENKQLDLSLQLQNLPIFCLNAYILATETDTSEIAQTLCQLIWDKAFPDQDYPQEVTTASKLREHLKKLKLTRNQPKLNLLVTHCEHPTDELIAFCHKLTNILSIAWLTDKSLEAPLKGFPPHQPNLLSAIQTWLEET
ncbi:HEAT repeat domain-containing protein [Planktothrix paucivesiculata]|nr:HEAT repeat domain-containing protein [Planktothrix paucivesiculata]